MKNTSNMIPALLCVLLVPSAALAATEEQKKHSSAHAHAEAYASGEGSHVERKTVIVTSENGHTVRKTTIFRNGKEETQTEILDGEGNVSDGGEDSGQEETADDTDENGGESGPWIGLRVEEASEVLRSQLGLKENQGVVINAVAPGGPAEDAGLELNDILLKFDGQALGTPEDLRRALDSCVVGQQVKIDHLRRGSEQQTTVTLEEEPAGKEQDEAEPKQNSERPDRRDVKGGDSKRKGSIKVEVSGDSLDAVLENPDVPDHFKDSVREMQERMREFEKLHMPR